jgi:hypothetical protein
LHVTLRGIDHGSSDGQPAGILPIGPPHAVADSPLYGPRMPAGDGASDVRFEQGELDFNGGSRLRFRLGARSAGGMRSASKPVTVTLSRPS